MTYVSDASTFTSSAKLPFDQLIAHLRLAAKYPLRITCFGVATFVDDDPEADAISFDHVLRLAECRSLDGAIAEAERCIMQGDCKGADTDAWTYTPYVIAIHDSEGGLVAAGEVRMGAVRWCQPVMSDGEARKIVTEASRLRGLALSEAKHNDHDAARSLRFSASVLEGRLVDRFWREPARAALPDHPSFLNQVPAIAPGAFVSGARHGRLLHPLLLPAQCAHAR